MKRILSNFILALLLVCGLNYTIHPGSSTFRELIIPNTAPAYLSPTALTASPDGKRLYIACATANLIAVYDVENREILHRIEVPASPTGLALSADGKSLYVTCAAAKSRICRIATDSDKVRAVWFAGHTAMAPVISADGKLLYVCNRFNDSVQMLDLQTGKEVAHIPVDREPVSAVLSPDGKLLFVANHIHSGRADKGVVAATVSVIDTATRKLLKNIPLTNGSTLLRDLCISPDGKYIGITHILARFHLPTTTVEHGWMNDNALTLIDVNSLKVITTVLLDEDGRGAANPWAAHWNADGKVLLITHAGTHEVSVIDAPGLLAKVLALPARLESPTKPADSNAAQVLGDVPNDLEFLKALRTRVKLHGKGPRCLAVSGTRIFIGNYFSDSLSILDLKCGTRSSATIQLESPMETTLGRKGELYFNDATLCYQGWQSCASCHSADGRVDGMNWDLLNDGMGNPKNVKSLLFCFQTAPVMSMGVRSDAGSAIRAGLRSILFASPKEEVASAIDEYVKNLQPLPSPFLVHNRSSRAAERGRKLFVSARLGCAQCHRPPLFTDQQPHPVETGKFDQATDQFYTPALVELWRTAPYLHDGSAGTLRELLLKHRPAMSGRPAPELSETELDDVVAFLQTL